MKHFLVLLSLALIVCAMPHHKRHVHDSSFAIPVKNQVSISTYCQDHGIFVRLPNITDTADPTIYLNDVLPASVSVSDACEGVFSISFPIQYYFKDASSNTYEVGTHYTSYNVVLETSGVITETGEYRLCAVDSNGVTGCSVAVTVKDDNFNPFAAFLTSLLVFLFMILIFTAPFLIAGCLIVCKIVIIITLIMCCLKLAKRGERRTTGPGGYAIMPGANPYAAGTSFVQPAPQMQPQGMYVQPQQPQQGMYVQPQVVYTQPAPAPQPPPQVNPYANLGQASGAAPPTGGYGTFS